MEKTFIKWDIEISTTITLRNYDNITLLFQKQSIGGIGPIAFVIEVLKLLVIDSNNIARIESMYDEELDIEEVKNMTDVVTSIMSKLTDDKKK